MIDQFAKTTLDPDPMHIDPQWCEKYGPFPTTIAFGFLTMSLITTLVHDLLKYDRESRIGTGGFPLNYGFNKLRLIAPVPVNSNLSITMKLLAAEERKPGQILQTSEITIHIEGQETPAVVGEWLAVWVNEDLEAKAS